jgi:hypothetical protein
MQRLENDREADVPSRSHAHPSPARRLRAIASLVLFFAVGFTHYIPVAEIHAEASGPGWSASHEANVLITGGSSRSSSHEKNDVPGEVRRGLLEVSQLGSRPLGGLAEFFVGVGSLLSVRWRRGAIYGGIAAVAWLGAVLAFQQNLQREVDALQWPGSLDLDFLSALGYLIVLHTVLIGWFIARWIMDRREDRAKAATGARS